MHNGVLDGVWLASQGSDEAEKNGGTHKENTLLTSLWGLPLGLSQLVHFGIFHEICWIREVHDVYF